MRLIIVRHGDTDYTIDSLTEKGWREAELLADRLSKMNIKAFYVSPLGRAKDTASCTLKKMNRTAETCEWLREFSPRINRPDNKIQKKLAWDWLPSDWTKEPKFYDAKEWYNVPIMQEAHVKEEYEWVCNSFDDLLEKHGYKREGKYYRVLEPNADTLVFFCHFGLEMVLLSHLMSVSPMILWHGMCAAPTSMTTVYTEERREGIASFRAASFGDTSHLYIAGEEPSFAARFCEMYINEEERHD